MHIGIAIGSINTRGQLSTSYRRPSALLMWRIALLLVIALACTAALYAQNQFEKRRISTVQTVIVGADAKSPLIEEYRIIARETLGANYSTPRVRDALEALYQTKRIDTITVAAALDSEGNVELTFTIKPKTQAGRIAIELGPSEALG